MSTLILLIYISTFSVAIPFIAGVIKFKSLNKQLRLFSLFLLITLIKESVCAYFFMNSANNMPIYVSMQVLVYLIYLYLYYHEFYNQNTRKLIKFLSTIIILIYFIDLLFINKLYKINIFTTTFGGIFLTLLSLLYFYNLIKNLEHQNLLKVPMFWLSSSVLFYNVGTIILFSLYDVYYKLPHEININLWTINSVLNILQNILITIGLIWLPRNQQTSSN